MRSFEQFARGFIDRDAMSKQATNTMERAFYGHDGRIAHKWHHYLEIYDRHFSRFVGHPVRILEIGVAHGGSLQIWKKYFGAKAIVHGVDIDPACARYADDGVTVHIGTQTDGRFLSDIADRMGGVDIVVDDGGHVSAAQISTFEVLYPRLSDDGIYVCEDTHASYWRAFGGGYRRPGSFIEHTKGLIDRLHAWYVEDPDDAARDESFARTTFGISIYDSIVVFERRKKNEPFHCMVGTE
jgi:hypothetical protein